MPPYLITGLRVKSDFDFPSTDAFTRSGSADADVDVVIEFCDDVGVLEEPLFANEWAAAAPLDFVFRPIPGLSIRVRDGRYISISRTGNVSDRDVSLFLAGSAWGVLCHQRGLLPIHCSAVSVSGRGMAFTGQSGAGKSTLAAALARRGYAHLCDDVAVIDVKQRPIHLQPLAKGLKLKADAIDILGIERGEPVSDDAGNDKYYARQQRAEAAPPVPGTAVYVLKESDDGVTTISPLRGSAHVEQLLGSIYRVEWLSFLRKPAEVFLQISELAGCLKFFEFSRPRDMTLFEDALDVLERHMVEQARAGGP